MKNVKVIKTMKQINARRRKGVLKGTSYSKINVFGIWVCVLLRVFLFAFQGVFIFTFIYF